MPSKFAVNLFEVAKKWPKLYLSKMSKKVWLVTQINNFLPDPPPPAGLVYILNFPSVCLFVCLFVPRVFSMIEWPNQKKSRVGLYCKFLKDAGTAKKNCPKVVPNITKPLPHHLCTVGGG